MKQARKNNDYLLSFEETKAKYFSDKPKFDEIEYNKQHMKSLADSLSIEQCTQNEIYLSNSIKRGERYLINHQVHKHYNEYKLIENALKLLKDFKIA